MVHGLYFSSDNVLSIRCYTNELCARVRYLGWCMGAPTLLTVFKSQQFFSTTEVNSQTKSKAFCNRASLQKQPTVHGASTEWRCETSWC